MGVYRPIGPARFQTKELQSPVDPNVTFVIKKATNREDVARQNLFSKVRYIQEDESGRIIQERDFPLGDLQIEIIKLCLVDWNLEDEKGKKLPITTQTVLDALEIEERRFLFDEIMKFNPLWSGGEEAKES